jgi:hypothetical protein
MVGMKTKTNQGNKATMKENGPYRFRIPSEPQLMGRTIRVENLRDRRRQRDYI